MLYNRLWVLFVPIKVIDRAEKTRKLKKGFVINDFTYNKVSPVHTFSPPLLLPETDLPVVAIYQKCRCPYLRGCSLSDFSSCQQVGDVQKWPRINVILPSVVSSISFFYFESTSDSDTWVQIYSQCFHFWLCHIVEHNYRICCLPVISGIFCHAAAHLDQFLCSRKDASQIMRKLETARIKFSPLLHFYFCGEQAGVGHDRFLSRCQSNRQLAFNMSLLARDVWKYSGVWICKVDWNFTYYSSPFPLTSTNYHHRI